MSMQINVPTSATDRAVADVQVHSAKMLSIVYAAKRSFELPQGLADQLRQPSITISQGLADPIWSAKSLADSIARKNQQVLEVSQRLQATSRDTQALAKRFALVSTPILAEHRRFEQTVAEFMKPIRDASIAARLTLPVPAVGFGGRPSLPDTPLVRVASKAARIVECALQRLRDRRRRDGDVRHRVELIVDLPLGGTAIVTEISATEDGLIQILGNDVEGLVRECFIAPDAIQYEIAVITMPPPGAQLTVVE